MPSELSILIEGVAIAIFGKNVIEEVPRMFIVEGIFLSIYKSLIVNGVNILSVGSKFSQIKVTLEKHDEVAFRRPRI